jgi:hypothetical protein
LFTRARIIPTGGLSYLDFMAPGILAQSVLFVAIFYGIAVIWERDLGIVHKFLASSTPRAALGLGKAHLSILEGLTGDANCFLEANITATTAATSSRCAKLHGHRISRECFY